MRAVGAESADRNVCPTCRKACQIGKRSFAELRAQTEFGTERSKSVKHRILASGRAFAFGGRRPIRSRVGSDQRRDRLAIFKQVLRSAPVVQKGEGGIDPQDVVKSGQHVLHLDRVPDAAGTEAVGRSNHLAGL